VTKNIVMNFYRVVKEKWIKRSCTCPKDWKVII